MALHLEEIGEVASESGVVGGVDDRRCVWFDGGRVVWCDDEGWAQGRRDGGNSNARWVAGGGWRETAESIRC